jgi:radical SAM superfamily enzyme YgiQ (UPF0313 family)
MKILILNPPSKDVFVKEGRCEYKAEVGLVYPPYTLAIIAAIAREKHEVKVIDAIGERKTYEKVQNEYKNFKPDYLIVNTSTPTIKNDLEIIKKLKKIHNAKTVLIEIHPSYFSKDIIKLPFIDFIARGEPEITIKELLSKRNLINIKGLTFKNDEKIIENSSRPFLKNLDKLPYPAWDLINLSCYREPLKNKPYVIIQTSRGCPNKCIFCTASYYYGKIARFRDINSILKEIDFIKERFGINHIFFTADTFTINNLFIKKLLKKVKKKNITFMCNSRVDTVDLKTLKLMKDAGCKIISFGIESGDQKVLDKFKKNITLEKSKTAVEMANKIGLFTIGYFILCQEDNEDSIKKTINFSKLIGLDFAIFNIATPFPGSELYEINKKKIKNKEWEKFEYGSSVLDNELNLRKWRGIAYKKFYLRLPYLFKLSRKMGLISFLRLSFKGIKFITGI